MKEVVDEILAAEKKVEETLGTARLTTAQLRQESETEAAAIIAAAQEKAQNLILATIAAAHKDAEALREKAFSDFKENQQMLLDRHKSKLDALVDEIVAMIITPAPEER